MYCNIASLTIVVSNVGGSNDLQYIRWHILSKGQRDNGEYRRQLMISLPEWQFIKRLLEGKEEFNPYFDDGIHHLKFHNRGLREVVATREAEDNWYTFPLAELVPIIDRLVDIQRLMPEESYRCGRGQAIWVADQNLLASWSVTYAPVVQWVYTDVSYLDAWPGVYDRLLADMLLNPELDDCLGRLESIAGSHSDGKPATVTIGFDGMPQSGRPANYYFSITGQDGRRVINGGIIAHKDSREYSGYRYSTHT